MEFIPSVLYDHVLCIIEIIKNDYVFSSSNHHMKNVCDDVDYTAIVS